MQGHDIVAIGGSAGAVEVLRSLFRALPADLPAALFVVLHLAPDKPSLLPTLLNHAGKLLALHPSDGTPIRHGCVYIAPPDHHMLIEGPLVRVVRGPRENRCRPAIDPLFRSAAACFGPRVVGVVLSGTLDDGTAGLQAIHRHGGVTMVQDPSEAAHSSMPASALAAMPVDYCLEVAELGRRIIELVRDPVDEIAKPQAADAAMDRELDSMSVNVKEMAEDERTGTSSPYSCPECGGVLWEIDDEGLLRFRCRVGHAFSADSMLGEQSDALERALWVALKTLEERMSLLRRLLQKADSASNEHIAVRFREDLRSAQLGASTIRKVLLRVDLGAPSDSDSP